VAAGFYEREININIESAVEEVGKDVDGDRCLDAALKENVTAWRKILCGVAPQSV